MWKDRWICHHVSKLVYIEGTLNNNYVVMRVWKYENMRNGQYEWRAEGHPWAIEGNEFSLNCLRGNMHEGDYVLDGRRLNQRVEHFYYKDGRIYDKALEDYDGYSAQVFVIEC